MIFIIYYNNDEHNVENHKGKKKKGKVRPKSRVSIRNVSLNKLVTAPREYAVFKTFL